MLQKMSGVLFRPNSLLVIDSYPEDLNEEIKELLENGRTDMAIIPECLPSALQSLDVSITKPHKNGIEKNMLSVAHSCKLNGQIQVLVGFRSM